MIFLRCSWALFYGFSKMYSNGVDEGKPWNWAKLPWGITCSFYVAEKNRPVGIENMRKKWQPVLKICVDNLFVVLQAFSHKINVFKTKLGVEIKNLLLCRLTDY